MITIQEAERIRKSLGLTEYEFSCKLGYSPTAYQYANKTKKLSRWMAREIVTRYGRVLSEIRED
jgi:hypothetical protein